MNLTIKTTLLTIALLSTVLCAAVWIPSIIAPRVIASVEHPNGTRVKVIQEFNYSPELFTTTIYFDDGDGQWRWYYFDHEDSYWGNAYANIYGSEIYIGSKQRSIIFDTVTGTHTFTNTQGVSRTIAKSHETVALPTELLAQR